MKTLKNLFRNEASEKSINNFSNALNFNALLMIKGGGDPDVDLWPPIDEDDDDDETEN
jgi:hypothetical protein